MKPWEPKVGYNGLDLEYYSYLHMLRLTQLFILAILKGGRTFEKQNIVGPLEHWRNVFEDHCLC